jgi:hypothetical protein
VVARRRVEARRPGFFGRGAAPVQIYARRTRLGGPTRRSTPGSPDQVACERFRRDKDREHQTRSPPFTSAERRQIRLRGGDRDSAGSRPSQARGRRRRWLAHAQAKQSPRHFREAGQEAVGPAALLVVRRGHPAPTFGREIQRQRGGVLAQCVESAGAESSSMTGLPGYGASATGHGIADAGGLAPKWGRGRLRFGGRGV